MSFFNLRLKGIDSNDSEHPEFSDDEEEQAYYAKVKANKSAEKSGETQNNSNENSNQKNNKPNKKLKTNGKDLPNDSSEFLI